MQTNRLIKQILNKEIQPTKIYKGTLTNLFTIEVLTREPISFISVLYKTEELRDKGYVELDNKAFLVLSFNPNKC